MSLDEDDEFERRPSPRWHGWLAAGLVVALVAAIGAGLLVHGRSSSSTLTGQVAPDFRLPDLRDTSRTVSLASLRGRPVVLNFWAAWCTPCVQELPGLQRVHARFASRVTFFGVDNRDSRRLALELLRRSNVTYDSGYDPGGVVASRYRLLGMPMTFVISPAGRVLWAHVGQVAEADLQAQLDRFVGR
ncbi:MAG: redoxin domain-containing protein [Actinobacteria bacterium]|nr:MAG: redoxin domain-containing protein [Actinomycetota bacterium]